MDKRKNNGGHATNGGRKPKIDEIKLIEQMDAVLAPAEAWEALAFKVKERDVQAIKTWLGYRFGMPKQTIEQTNHNIDLTPIFGDNPLDNDVQI
jgi:hypothetical protein